MISICDPASPWGGKNKDVHHKEPDYCVLVNKYSIIIIEYDENSSHEKSVARLNVIKEMLFTHSILQGGHRENTLHNIYTIQYLIVSNRR